MKSSASLFIGCLLFVVLDMIEPASGCHGDHHGHRSHSPEPYLSSPNVQALETDSVGATWANLYGNVIAKDSIALNYIQDVGFQYREADGKEGWQRVPAGLYNTSKFTTLIKDLKPATTYMYLAYLIWDDDKYTSNVITFTTKEEEELSD